MTVEHVEQFHDRHCPSASSNTYKIGHSAVYKYAFAQLDIEGTVEVPRFHGQRLTEHFTASTCRSCSRITIAGLWNGLRIDLEPLALTDVGEYLAIRDGVKTWNLWSDRVATTRDLASIQHPTITDRHAQHSCQADYGTEPPTRRRTWESPQVPDEPPF